MSEPRDAKQDMVAPNASGSVLERLMPKSFRRHQRLAGSPAAPASNAAEQAPSLNVAFSEEAASEEKIRQAARTSAVLQLDPAEQAIDRESRASIPFSGDEGKSRSDKASTGPAGQRTRMAGEMVGESEPREAGATPLGNTAFHDQAVCESPALMERAAQRWARDLYDTLVEVAGNGNWRGLKDILESHFAVIASAMPTQRAIALLSRVLLAHDPGNSSFQTAVIRATEAFLVVGPRHGAAEIERVLRAEGVCAAAATLRRLTDPRTADPLSAGLILGGAKKTLDEIASHLAATSHGKAVVEPQPQTFEARLPFSVASTEDAWLSQVFSDLNAAADSASRSWEGMVAARRLARLLQDAPIDPLVAISIGKGDGIVLPLEIARLRVEKGAFYNADALARVIQAGIAGQRERIRQALTILDDTMSLLMAEAAIDDSRPGSAPGGTAEPSRYAYPRIAFDADAHLLAVNRHGFELMRVMTSLHDAEPWLDQLANHEELRMLSARPDESESPELAFVLGAMPASIFEALRHRNADLLKDGADGDPFLGLQEAALAQQGFQGFRQFLANIHLRSAQS